MYDTFIFLDGLQGYKIGRVESATKAAEIARAKLKALEDELNNWDDELEKNGGISGLQVDLEHVGIYAELQTWLEEKMFKTKIHSVEVKYARMRAKEIAPDPHAWTWCAGDSFPCYFDWKSARIFMLPTTEKALGVRSVDDADFSR